MSAVETTTGSTTGTWVIDPSHSSIEFAVKHMMITTVKGRFGQLEGSIHPESDGSDGWVTEVRIDAASIDTRADQRDTHLRSADFLDVESHPHLTFRSRRLEGGFADAGDSFRVYGELTIRGETREVVLDATFEGVGRDPWGGDRMSFTASTKIDRREFGLTWNQGLEAGGVLVGNEVAIQIDVQVVKQA